MLAKASTSKAPLFRDLAAEAVEAVLARMSPRFFEAGEPICLEHEPGDSLFLIERGHVQVMVGGSAEAVTVARYWPGDVVGEMAVARGSHRTATVVAVVPTSALELSRDDFWQLARAHPKLLENLAVLLSDRLAESNARQTARRIPAEVVAFLVGRGAGELAARVIDEARGSSVRPVTAIQLAASAPASASGPTVPSAENALLAVDELLPTSGTIAIVAEIERPDLPLLLVHADRTIVLAAGDDLSAVERLAMSATWPIDIALSGAGGPGARPTTLGGRAILRRVAAEGHAMAADVAWLGRHLARTKLGVALGAGGAKGFAHAGVVEVLRASGYRPDYISGTSMGALVGALLAMGLSDAEMEAAMERAFTPERVQSLFRYGRKGSGNEALLNAFEEAIGGTTFADLVIPLSVVTVDLAARRVVPISEGPLIPALLASISLPGFLPPVERGAERLVDGIVLDPVPVSAASACGADLTVAVNVLGTDVLPCWPGEEDLPAEPRPKPSVVDALFETVDLTYAASSTRAAERADVAIAPRFGPGSWKDFHRARAFRDAGRAAATGELGALAALRRPAR